MCFMEDLALLPCDLDEIGLVRTKCAAMRVSSYVIRRIQQMYNNPHRLTADRRESGGSQVPEQTRGTKITLQ
jgi:hypothetical protein